MGINGSDVVRFIPAAAVSVASNVWVGHLLRESAFADEAGVSAYTPPLWVFLAVGAGIGVAYALSWAYTSNLMTDKKTSDWLFASGMMLYLIIPCVVTLAERLSVTSVKILAGALLVLFLVHGYGSMWFVWDRLKGATFAIVVVFLISVYVMWGYALFLLIFTAKRSI